MRPLFDFSHLFKLVGRAISGPQMLAFLPALCLSAYWVGGDMLLVLCALATPLFYVAFGGLRGWFEVAQSDDAARPTLKRVANDFLAIARHNGQTTACFQIGIAELDQLSSHFGTDSAAEARDVIISRLQSALRSSDHVFATGSSRFTILIAPGFRLRLDSLLDLGKRLRAAAEMPLSLGGRTQTLTACIGIASSLNFGRNITADTWVASASDALEDAVLTGTNAVRLWSDRLSRKHQARQTMQQDIVAALDEGRFQAFYQPQVNLRTGDVAGVEVFARWDHAARGILTAEEFLQAAQSSQQMTRLGRSMMLQAIATLQAWDDAGFGIKSISLNLSEDELRDPELPDHFIQDLERCGVPPHRVVFDIPETVVALRLDDIILRNLTALSELGCGLDLEGFGMGGCSISKLQQLPITRLKLDRSLLNGIEACEGKQRTLRAALAIGDTLGLPSIAAGIETLEQHGVLKELGCKTAQGFLFAPPASAADTTLWLTKRSDAKHSPEAAQLRLIK